jgi:DNA-binding NarL/FixJ family response regulator
MINLKKDLTEKEWTIIKLKAQGKTAKEIGEILGRSPKTVRNRLLTIYKKLEVSGAIEMLKKLHDEYGVDVWGLE